MFTNLSATIVGNLADDPELRFTPAGIAAVKFTVAVNDRKQNKTTGEWEDAGVSFVNCTAWRNLAEHIGGSLKKGDRVIAVGSFRQRSYDKDGKTVYVWDFTADAVGPELTYATATVKKMTRGAGRDDPWAADAQAFAQPAADMEPAY